VGVSNCPDLEGERLAVPERRAAVESETGNAEDGELHCYDIARFTARVIGSCLVDGGHSEGLTYDLEA
jgi:hypothetical protein